MNTDSCDFEILIDRDRPSAARVGLWVIFTLVFVAVTACAVWVFCFSSRGLNFHSVRRDAVSQLSAPSAAPGELPFVGVSLPSASMRLRVGDRTMTTATLKLSAGSPYVNVSGLPVKWKSENPEIASVNNHGEIVARSPGRTRISVSVADSRVDANEAFCMVMVLPEAVPVAAGSGSAVPPADSVGP